MNAVLVAALVVGIALMLSLVLWRFGPIRRKPLALKSESPLVIELRSHQAALRRVQEEVLPTNEERVESLRLQAEVWSRRHTS